MLHQAIHQVIHRGTPEHPFITLPRLRGRDGSSIESLTPRSAAAAPSVYDSLPDRAEPPAADGFPFPATMPSAAALNSDLPGTGPKGSVTCVLAERLRQMEAGHTPEAVAVKGIFEMLSQLRLRLGDAEACWSFNAARRDPRALRKALVKSAAYTLALIDRLDVEPM